MTLRWFWLSFCDTERAAGMQFLGACVVGPASDLEQAVKLAWHRGCNPGGQVAGQEVPETLERKIPDSYRSRLLSKQEAGELDQLLGAFVN